jgi:hypothetical protein
MLHRNPHTAPAHWFGEAILNFRASAHTDPRGPIGARQQNQHNAQVKEFLDRLWSEAFQSGAAYYASIEMSSPFLVVTEEQRDAMLAQVEDQEEPPAGPRIDEMPPAVRERMSSYNQRMINRVNAEELAALRHRVRMLESAIDGACSDLANLSPHSDIGDAHQVGRVLKIIKDRK